jgi:RimJ/RimL family protein N-acetyltransferase
MIRKSSRFADHTRSNYDVSELRDVQRNRPPAAFPVDSRSRLRPEHRVIEGRYAVVEPLDPAAHATQLFDASHGDEAKARIWDYLPSGPFPTFPAFLEWLSSCAASTDPLFFAIRDSESGKATGMASYLNIHPDHGSIEIGHIMFGSLLQKTPAATEALYLMLCYALDDLGYRRMEWKCNGLNQPSRRAAVRLGFTFEGIFYQHMIVKGQNRDTAWFSILDGEWPRLRANFEAWLAPENFDESGQQRTSLSILNRAAFEESWE